MCNTAFAYLVSTLKLKRFFTTDYKRKIYIEHLTKDFWRSMIVQKAKKSKKGLSGAITALILVIASVIIALVVVFFAFGYLGAFSSSPTVTQIGTGYICPSSSGGGTLYVTLSSSATTTIVGVEVGGTSAGASVSLPAGTTNAAIPLPSSVTFVAGQTYTITLVLSSGATVTISAVAK
jgi:hypothetical protein